MRAISSRVVLALFSLAVPAAALVACSDDSSAPRAPFETDDASTSDAAPVAEDAGAGTDASTSDAATPVEDGSVVRAPFDPSPATITCGTGACAKRIVAGTAHYCVVLSDDSLRCWGKTAALAPPANAAEPAVGPRTVAAVASVVDIAAGGDSTCVLGPDGTVTCWDNLSKPAAVTAVQGADRVWVSSNGNVRCARVSGDLMCWSPTWVYQGGVVAKVELGGAHVQDVALSSNAKFVVDGSGILLSTGTEISIMGHPSSSVASLASPVENLPPVLSLAVSSHACALAIDGRLFCWGSGSAGQLGLGYSRDELRPLEVEIPSAAWPQQIAVASDHSCLRTTDGALWCWGGTNARGQLGYPESIGVYLPTRVESLDPTSTASVATGNASTCAIATDGTVRCWGDNAYGQLGRGAIDSLRHPSPAAVELE